MSDMKTYTFRAHRVRAAAVKATGVAADERGALNALVLPLILLFLFFMGAMGFGLWAFSGRQDFKNNVDQKIAVAVSAAQKDTQASDAKQYAEQAKQPYDTYIGPSAFGNINLKYPRTWSAYVAEDSTNSTPVDGYFHPNFVPDLGNDNNNYALRVQVVQQSYDSVLQQYDGQVTNKQLTVAPYSLPKVPSVVGSRLEGQISDTKQGVMIVLPLRNMTLKIWTTAYQPDLDNTILPNFSFQP